MSMGYGETGRTLTKEEADNYAKTYKAIDGHKLQCNICGAISNRTPCNCWKNIDLKDNIKNLIKRIEKLEKKLKQLEER